MNRHVRATFTTLVLLLLQTTIVPFLALDSYLPDLLLIWVVYTAIRRGQVEAAVMGFLVGLLQDATTTQFFGLAALAKTVGGFAAGYFFNENKTEQTLSSYRFLLILLLVSLIHNILYFTIFFQGIEVSLLVATLRTSVFTSLYTVLFGMLPMFAFARKYSL
jgi:rod shape-determining protein MreD